MLGALGADPPPAGRRLEQRAWFVLQAWLATHPDDVDAAARGALGALLTRRLEHEDAAREARASSGLLTSGLQLSEEQPVDWKCRAPCLRTALHLPAWAIGRLRPLLRNVNSTGAAWERAVA